MAKRTASSGALKALREFGLRYPAAHLKSPWPGHLDLAVKDKTFAYLSVEGEPFSISCKLPQSNALALMLPFTEPTAYGLGKSGWVSAKVAEGKAVPLEMFKAWIDESYRALAPKKLVAALGAEAASAAHSKRAPAVKRAPAASSKSRVSRPQKKSAKPKR